MAAAQKTSSSEMLLRARQVHQQIQALLIRIINDYHDDRITKEQAKDSFITGVGKILDQHYADEPYTAQAFKEALMPFANSMFDEEQTMTFTDLTNILQSGLTTIQKAYQKQTHDTQAKAVLDFVRELPGAPENLDSQYARDVALHLMSTLKFENATDMEQHKTAMLHLINRLRANPRAKFTLISENESNALHQAFANQCFLNASTLIDYWRDVEFYKAKDGAGLTVWEYAFGQDPRTRAGLCGIADPVVKPLLESVFAAYPIVTPAPVTATVAAPGSGSGTGGGGATAGASGEGPAVDDNPTPSHDNPTAGKDGDGDTLDPADT